MAPSGETRPALHAERRGRGPTVGLVHGFTQSGASWRRVSARLGARYTVVTPDLPGHGASPLGASGSPGGLTATGRALGAAVGRGSYVGYSLGGRCCLHLALDDRDRLVERLVIVGTHPGIADPKARDERRSHDDVLADRLERAGPDGLAAFVDEWLAGPLFRHLSDEAADRPSRLVNTAAGLAWSLRSCGTGTQAPLWDRLAELSIPVLVVVGAKDAKFRPIAERTTEAIGGNARMAVVPGAGHAVPFERPEAFADLVSSFLLEP